MWTFVVIDWFVAVNLKSHLILIFLTHYVLTSIAVKYLSANSYSSVYKVEWYILVKKKSEIFKIS